jgi:hypothetical protein
VQESLRSAGIPPRTGTLECVDAAGRDRQLKLTEVGSQVIVERHEASDRALASSESEGEQRERAGGEKACEGLRATLGNRIRLTPDASRRFLWAEYSI